jgi:hypothetical protein
MVMAATIVTLSGCGSSSFSSSSTTESTAVASPGTASQSAVSSVPPPASSLPSAHQEPCSALAATIGVADLRPKDTGNWIAERSRILTDSQREAGLLGTAAAALAPDPIAVQMATLKAYASWIATTVQASATFSAASAALDRYPDASGVPPAVAAVAKWTAANC